MCASCIGEPSDYCPSCGVEAAMRPPPFEATHPDTLLFTQPLKLLGCFSQLPQTPFILKPQFLHRPLVGAVHVLHLLTDGRIVTLEVLQLLRLAVNQDG